MAPYDVAKEYLPGPVWRRGGGAPPPAAVNGFGGAFIIFAAGLTQAQASAVASQVRDILLAWTERITADNADSRRRRSVDDAADDDKDGSDTGLDGSDSDSEGGSDGGSVHGGQTVKMRFTLAYCGAGKAETVSTLPVGRMVRCRRGAVEAAHAWLEEQIQNDQGFKGEGAAPARRAGALTAAAAAVCAVRGYAGESLYIVASHAAESLVGEDRGTAAATVAATAAALSSGGGGPLMKVVRASRGAGLASFARLSKSRPASMAAAAAAATKAAEEAAAEEAAAAVAAAAAEDRYNMSKQSGAAAAAAMADALLVATGAAAHRGNAGSWSGHPGVPVHCTVLGPGPPPPAWPCAVFGADSGGVDQTTFAVGPGRNSSRCPSPRSQSCCLELIFTRLLKF